LIVLLFNPDDDSNVFLRMSVDFHGVLHYIT
jgi:hypothetical protein